MAGSYKHIVNADGSFRGTELLDNLGDAYEALEECFEMIQWLSHGDPRMIHKAWLEGYFKKNCPIDNLPMASFEEWIKR